MDIFREAGGRYAQLDESAVLFDDAEGKPVADKASAAIVERFWQLFEQAIEHSKADSSEISIAQSLKDYFVECLAAESREFRTQVLQYAQLWGCFVGTDIRKQSLKFFYFEQVCQSVLSLSHLVDAVDRLLLVKPPTLLAPIRM